MTKKRTNNTAEITLYIAMSMDGYIATEDGDISFLSMVESPGEDYGYSEFIQTVDTVIMGRKTYDKISSFGSDFPHTDKKSYVLSRKKTGKEKNVEFWNESLESLIEKIKEEKGRHIFLDGGAEIIHECMNKSLINTFVISIVPILLGSGIRLFKEGFPSQKLKLIHARSFSSGLVQTHYSQGL